ncbi:hypothetical protein FACS189483_02920 [Spirochaetia bacterium]|nr:hypothetical protein FACS189483_02920 [Spirochaetia bacterium]
MKKKVFFAGMAAMVLAFGLVLVGCGEEKNPSLTISGTAKAGETLTASGEDMSNYVTWYLFDDADCAGEKSYGGMGETYQLSSYGHGYYIRAFGKATVKTTEDTEVWSNILGPVEALPVETSVTINPNVGNAFKGSTYQLTVTINEMVANSNSIVWTVEGSTPSGTSTITGSGHNISGSITTQTRNFNVGSSETATTLTVKVTYNGKSATGTFTVSP